MGVFLNANAGSPTPKQMRSVVGKERCHFMDIGVICHVGNALKVLDIVVVQVTGNEKYFAFLAYFNNMPRLSAGVMAFGVVPFYCSNNK